MTMAHDWRPATAVNPATPWGRTVEGLHARLQAERADEGLPPLPELPETRVEGVHPGRHDDVVAQLRLLGCIVTPLANFDSQPGGWCAIEGAMTAFRVIGAPADGDPHNPLIDEDTCRDCVLTAARQACTEAVRGPVRIEVAA
jgi:hypothetical protein